MENRPIVKDFSRTERLKLNPPRKEYSGPFADKPWVGCQKASTVVFYKPTIFIINESKALQYRAKALLKFTFET